MQNKVVVYMIIDLQCHWLSEDSARLVSWNYIVTCNKWDMPLLKKLPEEKAKQLLHAHVGGP
jgi:hypothetical protein